MKAHHVWRSGVWLAAAALLVLAVTGAEQGEQGSQKSDDPWLERRVFNIKYGGGKVFKLRFPRFTPAAPGEEDGFRRLYENTCGLFDILYHPANAKHSGPPPHVHYADDEYFFILGTGATRIYAPVQAEPVIPGFVPGFNAPPVEVGSAVISNDPSSNRSYVFSPKGSVHTYAHEENTTEFIAIHATGYAFPLAYALNFQIDDPAELLAQTGLYGVPHDVTGAMFAGFGNVTGCVESRCWQGARGPVDLSANQFKALKRLQAMFDKAEACYPEQ